MSTRNENPIETTESRKRKGICPQCLSFVGKEKLLTVCDKWMCVECGQKAIDLWNALVTET